MNSPLKQNLSSLSCICGLVADGSGFNLKQDQDHGSNLDSEAAQFQSGNIWNICLKMEFLQLALNQIQYRFISNH